MEKKYVEEREKRIQLEAIVAQYQEDISSKRRECAEITLGQKLALALAEQFRAKCERDIKFQDNDRGESCLMNELKNANRECLLLQDELSKMKNAPEAKISDDKYKERALKAESELETLRKNRENVPRPVEEGSTDVQQIMAHHRNAYADLLLAKKCAETEYKSKCRSLETEMARLHGYYEKRIAALNDKLKQSTHLLQEKTILIESLSSNKNLADIKLLEKRIAELGVQGHKNNILITSLNETIAAKEKCLILERSEKAEALKKANDLQQNFSQAQAQLTEKTGYIESLRAELETKSLAISVKEKMLNDQQETINSLKNSLKEMKKDEEARTKLNDLLIEYENLKEEKGRLLSAVEEMSTALAKAERYREGQEKNAALLRELEKQVYERQSQWEQQLSAMCREKDQAIQTAKFATKKLISAVGEYESQLKAHKQLQQLLKESLQEKEQKLEKTSNELEKLKTQAQLRNSTDVGRADVIDECFNLCSSR